VSQELQRKNDDSSTNRSLKSRALCLRLLREICFSPVMINGGLGVQSQLKTLNELLRKSIQNKQQHGKTQQKRTKKPGTEMVLSCDGALRFLSQHQRDANVGEEFVSEQQFRGGGGVTARAHATESIDDQLNRAREDIDGAAKKIIDARRKRAKAYWHLALELITTGASCQDLLSRVSPKFTFLWRYRHLCIQRKEREAARGNRSRIALVLERGWRPPPSFVHDVLTSNRFPWAQEFTFRLDNIPPQISIRDIATALFSSSQKEPGVRSKLKQLRGSLEEAKKSETHLRNRIQSDITDAEKILEEAISYDNRLQFPAVIEISKPDSVMSDLESHSWMAYVHVSGQEVQQQLIRQAESTRGIKLCNEIAIPHIEAAIAEATKRFSQVDAEHTVHPCVENKAKKRKAQKALKRAKLGLTITFESVSSGSTQHVVMSRAFRGLRGTAPRSSSALVNGAHNTITLADDSLAVSLSRLEAGQSTMTKLIPVFDKGVSQYVKQKSAYDILQSLRRNNFDETVCSICLGPFGASSGVDITKPPVVSMISCGHFFCIPCLDKHIHTNISKNKHLACPICRKGFSPASDVMHIDHMANDDEDNEDMRNKAKKKVREVSEILENSEGVLLDGKMWNYLFLSIDIPTNVSNEPHHHHTALPRDVLAHIRAATGMKIDCGKSVKPQCWGARETTAGISTKIQALLRDLPLGEHAVVFSPSKEGVIHLATIIKDKGIHCFSLYTGQHTKTTEEAVASWGSTKIDASTAGPVLVVQSGAAASGLTLTVASRLFLMEPFTRQEEEQQAYARLHRYGQKKDVKVTIYFAPVSVESRLLFWRKRSTKSMARVGSSTNYVYTQLCEEEEEDSDDDNADLVSSASVSGKDEEESSEESAEDNLQTQFLLGLVDKYGNPTTRNENISQSAALPRDMPDDTITSAII